VLAGIEDLRLKWCVQTGSNRRHSPRRGGFAVRVPIHVLLLPQLAAARRAPRAAAVFGASGGNDSDLLHGGCSSSSCNRRSRTQRRSRQVDTAISRRAPFVRVGFLWSRHFARYAMQSDAAGASRTRRAHVTAEISVPSIEMDYSLTPCILGNQNWRRPRRAITFPRGRLFTTLVDRT
jgi:hypothetical protein